jgi:hypothetical protein
MSALIDRYWTHYGIKKRSASREKSVLEGVRSELGNLFVREVDGDAVGRWYESLTAVRDLSPGTAVRHFNVMHHMMEKAATLWSKETGIDRNPADQVVPVQREMEWERSALASIPPFGRGFSRHRGLSIRCGFEKSARGSSRAADHRLDESTRLSLGMVASLHCPLPFHLAQSL